MGLRFRIALVLSLFLTQVYAQLSPEFLAINSIERGKWEKAKKQLTKALSKDSLNAGALFGFSQYYFALSCPEFQIDSSYQFIIKAQRVFLEASAKQRERWRKLPMDSILLQQHRQKIDSAAFERAAAYNTEASYLDFIKRFKNAAQLERAAELRDEVAYIDALKENTYQAFETYLNKYPNSSRVEEANKRYQKLLFETKTRDKKLTSYENFIQAFPETPYRIEAELQIFQIMTASGDPSVFQKYITKYSTSAYAKEAINILYHLYKEDDLPFPTSLLSDSLKRIQHLEKGYVVPFLKDQLFGFINEHGEQIIKPQLDEIKTAWLCGKIFDELIVGDNIVITRNDKILFKGPVEDYEELGYGFLKIFTTNDCIYVIHYSGLLIQPLTCFEDAKILGGNFLALKRNGSWSIWTFTGRMLMPFNWDEVEQIGKVLALKKAGRINLIPVSEVALQADNIKVNFLKAFDEVKSWTNNKIWVRNGNREQVLNQDLTPWILEAEQELSPTFFGAVSKSSEGFSMIANKATKQIYSAVKIIEPWVAGKVNKYWNLISPETFDASVINYDSIRFNGPLAMGIISDSLHIYFTQTAYRKTRVQAKLQFLYGKDSMYYFLIEEDERKKVFDSFGNELFAIVADRLEYNNEGYFTITKKDKRGLIDKNGIIILQVEYDAIGPVQQGMLSILKDNKFGLVNISTKTQLKPEYEKNITPYSSAALVAYKKGAYGFISWNNKPLSNFEFEAIMHWSDSIAWVKKDFSWKLYNFIERKFVLDKVKRFRWVENSNDEGVIIFLQENNYGVISNKRGLIIQPTFSDIINLGSPESPLYFTVKHVEEAAIYVVIYYDKNGNQLLRQIFEEDEYDRIVCPHQE